VKRWIVLALAAGLSTTGAPTTAWAADGPPYHDLNSLGGLYLCDRSGHDVSSGSIDAKPFVWSAVSLVEAPSGFGGAGSSVTLYAYQPRKDAYPDRWNGDTLTAATGYPSGSRPTAVATPLDFSLRDFLSEFPAAWDGAVQLRMYFGSKANGYDGSDYASADLRVNGSRWTLLSDAGGPCSDATHLTAQSSEITIAHLDPSASASPDAPKGTRAEAGGSASAVAREVAAPRAAAPGASDAATAASASRWGTALGRAAALVGLAALVSVLVSVLRRRSARS